MADCMKPEHVQRVRVRGVEDTAADMPVRAGIRAALRRQAAEDRTWAVEEQEDSLREHRSATGEAGSWDGAERFREGPTGLGGERMSMTAGGPGGS